MNSFWKKVGFDYKVERKKEKCNDAKCNFQNKDIKKCKKKFPKIIKELVEIEIIYLNHLSIFEMVYKNSKPLKIYLKKKEHEILFLSTNLIPFHKKLLNGLISECVSVPPHTKIQIQDHVFGTLEIKKDFSLEKFINHYKALLIKDFCKVYGDNLCYQDTSSRIVRKLRANWITKKILTKLDQDKRTSRLGINSYLIVPNSRLARYKLLFKDLLKFNPRLENIEIIVDFFVDLEIAVTLIYSQHKSSIYFSQLNEFNQNPILQSKINRIISKNKKKRKPKYILHGYHEDEKIQFLFFEDIVVFFNQKKEEYYEIGMLDFYELEDQEEEKRKFLLRYYGKIIGPFQKCKWDTMEMKIVFLKLKKEWEEKKNMWNKKSKEVNLQISKLKNEKSYRDVIIKTC